jgi:putative tryptophan/tyrosine transport system substrate-binding protein
MRRRAFIAVLGGAAVVLPLPAHAQQPTMPVIGFLNSRSPDVWAPFVAAFREGLKEAGYVEGETIVVEYRWADNQMDLLPGFAAELVRRGVAVIVASGGDPPLVAATQPTTTIPIVANFGIDPVEQKFVASLNRPGGNVTGVNVFAEALIAKRLDLLRKLLPRISTVAYLSNPTSPYTLDYQKNFEVAAKALGVQAVIATAANEREGDAAFAGLVRQGVEALLLESDPFFLSLREHFVALAAQYALPVIYSRREYAAAGGLMGYAPSLTEAYRQLGVYAGRILKGAKPAELLVIQPNKFELVINLKTAKALGIEIPVSLLAAADEVIE